MSIPRILVPLLLLAGLAGPLAAQEAEINLTPLKTKGDLTDEDKAQLRAFITKRLESVRGEDEVAAQQATNELRTTYDGSDGFKRAYLAVCLDLIATAYKKADLVPATRMLTVINTFNTADALPVLLEALQDDRVGIRAAAAVGLRTLREKLAAAGRDVTARALTGLKEAGKREKSRDTLKTIYGAMNYAELSAQPDAKGNIAALLELLEERAKQYAGGDVRAVGADDAGLRIAQALVKSMDDAERKRLLVVTATMMKYAIEQYTSGDRRLSAVRTQGASRETIEFRNGVERLILVGEELLIPLLSPEKAPTVAENMRKVKTPDMIVEWQKWVTLLQKATNQDFTVTAQPAPEPEKKEATTKPARR